MSDTPNFWNHDHPLSEDYQRLCATNIPISGNCQTLQGELLRAASKIGYDWYNNGWGCNNWSGAVVFIRKKINDLPNQINQQTHEKLAKALHFVNKYSRGQSTKNLLDEHAEVAVTTITEIIVQAILNNPEPIVNTDDMLNYRLAAR